MASEFFFNLFHDLNSPFDSSFIKGLLIFCIIVLVIYIYNNATTTSGIQYVNLKRRRLYVNTSYNPFSFDVNYVSGSFSGIKCTLKSEEPCHVQAFWGAPIHPLFKLLHGNWQNLRNAIISYSPENFGSRCICANEPFQLSAGEEKTVEFKPRSDIDEDNFSQEATSMREVYPFVVLMILDNVNDIQDYDFVVIAMTSAVHIPDRNLVLYPQMIGQFIKVSTGQVGNVKRIFLSSPATSDDGRESSDLCIVCYHKPVSVVFLPCRHACLCNVCFELCDRCPICRATSIHYFQLPDNVKLAETSDT